MARLSNQQNWRAGHGGAVLTRPERSSRKHNDLLACHGHVEERPALLAVSVENGPKGAIPVPCSIDGCGTRAHAGEASYVNLRHRRLWAKRDRHEQVRCGGPNGI